MVPKAVNHNSCHGFFLDEIQWANFILRSLSEVAEVILRLLQVPRPLGTTSLPRLLGLPRSRIFALTGLIKRPQIRAAH